MKMREFACMLFCLAFLLSCSNEGSNENSPSGELPLSLLKISNRIGVEEAYRDYVEGARAFLDEQTPSKSRSSRAVNSVSVLLFDDVKTSAMKSDKYKEYKDLGISDTLAYVFNFGDSSGFVIVSNDKRVKTPLFAFTEKGTLLNGKTDNPGFALFLERLEGYVLNSIAESGKDDEKKESMVVAQSGPIHPIDFIGARPIVDPLLSVEWGQGGPFNNNLEYQNCYGDSTANNGLVATGCVPTAIAQIMSYWKYPDSLNGTTSYSWSNLNTFKRSNNFYASPSDNVFIRMRKASARAQVADLFQQIGATGTGVGTIYGCVASNTVPENAITFLISKGFTLYSNPYGAKLRTYDNEFVKMALQDYGPLYTVGTDPKRGGHAWIIDGMVYVYAPVPPPYPSEIYYVHNNWGWDGYQNGYYLGIVYDPNESLTFDPSFYNFKNIKVSLVYR